MDKKLTPGLTNKDAGAKRWEEREVPVTGHLIEILKGHGRKVNCRFVFPSPTGNRNQYMLDRCKAVARRAGLDSDKAATSLQNHPLTGRRAEHLQGPEILRDGAGSRISSADSRAACWCSSQVAITFARPIRRRTALPAFAALPSSYTFADRLARHRP